MCMEAAVIALLSELDGIFAFKEQRTTLKASLVGKDVFALLLTGFDKSFVGTPSHLMSPLVPTGSLGLLPTGSCDKSDWSSLN